MTKYASETERTESVEDHLSVDEWLKIRREAGLKIDPENAEVSWEWANTADPYGIDPELPPEFNSVGRVYFARTPETEIRVSFHDLPEEVRKRLWELLDSDSAVLTDISDDLPWE